MAPAPARILLALLLPVAVDAQAKAAACPPSVTGALTLRPLRPGLTIGAPDGKALRPRVVTGPSALELALPVQTDVPLEFFVVLYPDPAGPAPALRAELWRDGRKLGQVEMALPAADEQGARPYSGRMPTRSFADAAYTLRVVATQGDAETASEAGFRMHVPEPPAPVRLQPR